jgi:hypothetical protein
MSLLMNYELVAQCIGEISLTQEVTQWKKSNTNKSIVKSHFVNQIVFNLGIGMYVFSLVYVMMLCQLHSVKSEMTKWLYMVTWKGHGRRQVWHVERDRKVHFRDLCIGHNENLKISLRIVRLLAKIEPGTSKIGRRAANM